MPVPNKPCKWCGSTAHYATFCFRRPAKPPKARRPIARLGKQGKRTAAAVAKWKKTQEPNHQGFYQCYIGGDWIPYLRAEHPYSKASHPDMRTTQKLEPVCDEHNALKGPLDIDQFLEKYPEFKVTVKPEYLKEI